METWTANNHTPNHTHNHTTSQSAHCLKFPPRQSGTNNANNVNSLWHTRAAVLILIVFQNYSLRIWEIMLHCLFYYTAVLYTVLLDVYELFGITFSLVCMYVCSCLRGLYIYCFIYSVIPSLGLRLSLLLFNNSIKMLVSMYLLLRL